MPWPMKLYSEHVTVNPRRTRSEHVFGLIRNHGKSVVIFYLNLIIPSPSVFRIFWPKASNHYLCEYPLSVSSVHPWLQMRSSSMASSFRLLSSSKSESRIRVLSRALQARHCSSRSCQNEPHVSTAEPKYALGRIGDFRQSAQGRWLYALPFAMAVSAGAFAVGFEPQTSGCEANETPRVGGKGSTELVVKGSHKELSEGFLDELKAVCGDRVILDYDERYFHGKPQHSFHSVVNIPDVVVSPKSTEEVSKIVKACNKYKIPIVPYGGATSIEGHTLAPHGGLCIDMTSMKNVKALHLEDMDVVVEPGIGWIELNEYLLPYGLFFPLDPGPGATIGGMCATRCSGSLAVRYGTMRDNVINLQVVLANGDVVKTASRARKSAAGYDLTRLIIGSEGTLGVITQVTLRLQKIPESTVVAMCNFPTIKDAADVAIATMHSGIQVSRVELLDEVQVHAINNANGKDLPEFPTLMFEFVGTEAYAREQTVRVQNISVEHHGFDFVFVETPEEKEKLWKMRKEALWANLALEPECEAMTTDVCVPLSHLAEVIARSKAEIDSSPLTCPVIAHAGDGNFHTVILFNPEKEEHRQEAERLNNFMVHAALLMEGTCSGEHGVGTGKMKYLEKELGIEALRTMALIKHAVDPNNIMNPGKLIPPHVCF